MDLCDDKEQICGGAGGTSDKNNNEPTGGGNGVRFYMDTTDDDELLTIGDYEYYPRDKLGEGAYGSVYRGRQLSSGDEVALKLVPTERLKPGELEAIVKAQSGCVVRFLDLVTTDRLTYIIMELCHTDLATFLAAYGGKLDETNLYTVGRSLAEGYMVLHRNGIVHRDIKPQNILLNVKKQTTAADGGGQPEIISVKLTDFGCSRVISDGGDGMPCNLAGTFFYMAPEVGANVVEHHQYDEEVDMWSVGVVLYQCMVGRVPFDERQLCRLFLHAIDGNNAGYVPPVPDDGPESYRFVVGKLLQLDPSARLKPIQVQSYLAHDRPSAYVQCLREGSCSTLQDQVRNCNNNNNNNKSRDDERQEQDFDGSEKSPGKRRFSLDNLPSFRRTASALFSRLVAMCGQQHQIPQRQHL